MNPVLALPAVAMAQLGLALVADRSTRGLDRELFLRALRSYEANGIGDFFNTNPPRQGNTRATAILQLASLPLAARAAVASLLVSLAGVALTTFVVGSADPSHKSLRVVVGVIATVAALVALVGLLLQIARGAVRHRVPGEDAAGRGTGVRAFAGRYWLRVRSLDVLTPFLTVNFVVNLVAVGIANGV